MYDNSKIKFKASMIRPNLRDYSEAYILVKGTITVSNMEDECAAANNTNKKVIFKNCASINNCIIKINIIQVDDMKILIS